MKNSFLWNSMIRGYACNGFSLKSLVMCREMLNFGQKPDNFTYLFVLKACGDILIRGIGRKVHALVLVGGFESNIHLVNSLLLMYFTFGELAIVRLLFDKMSLRDLTSWNTVIYGYVKNGEPNDAFLVFDHMRRASGIGDRTTLLALLFACSDLMDSKLISVDIICCVPSATKRYHAPH
ncbi:hypothetical protein RJT34_22833 [Clitoria ternatea]|uniref:Pentatricopeptide repeat-containing protein n=1 Tax=Clitoria ternatea TaxID=43366 RepID=A0AAN9FMZ7_CLITE